MIKSKIVTYWAPFGKEFSIISVVILFSSLSRMDVPLRKPYCVLLLCMVLIFVSCETNGNPLSPNLLDAISKIIERYEKGELTATTSIHYFVDQNNVETLFLPGIIIWDPLLQYFHGSLPCPHCGQILKPRCWKDGKDWKHNSPRRLADIEHYVLLVSRVYACKNDHRIISHDPQILKMFEQVELIPFLLLHKYGITRRLYRLIIVHTASGMRYRDVETLLTEMWRSYHTEVRIRTSKILSMRTSEGEAANDASHNAYTMPQVSQLNPNRKLIRQCFVYDYFTKEKLYNARMASFTGSWLSSDHTFKVASNVGIWQNGHWIRQFDSLFSVMNEDGIVPAWQLTRGTGFARVKTLLVEIMNRLVKSGITLEGFSIDNCCAWRLLLQGVFGVIPVKLDLFHAVQRIASKIKKRHPLRRQCLDSFRLVFRMPGDIGKERKKSTPSRSVMLTNLDRFVENWENLEVAGEKVLSKNARNQLGKLRAHIEKGCLEGIPPKAGTSRQESMHKSLRKGVEKRRIGVKTAVASIGTCLYRWNERRISEKVGSCHSAVPVPVTEYHDLSMDQEEVFGTGVFQNPNSFSDDDLEDGAEVNARENDSTGDSSSEEEEYGTDNDNNVKITTEDTYHRVLEYAMYMKSLSQDLQAKCDAPTMKVNVTQCVGRSLLLFSSRTRYSRPDAEECDERLNSILNAFQFQQLPMPGDGDCFLRCISITLSSFLTINQGNSKLITYLKSIGISTERSNEDKINVLRQLIVQEFTGPNRHLYEPFMITNTTDSYDTEAQKFLRPGHYDSELGNCVPMAMSNILQIPLVIFTSMENYPITQIIPRTRVLSEVPIYLAYNHGGSGHYNLAVEVTHTQSNSTTTEATSKEADKHLQVEADVPPQHEAGCSCGRGNPGKTGKSEFCKQYKSRCPCFRNLRGCNEKCSCRLCANPFGRKTQEKGIFGPLPRKRQKQDLQKDMKQTDKGYMEKKTEEPIGTIWFEDELYVIEALFLYLLVTSQDITPDRVFAEYHKIIEFCSEVTIYQNVFSLRPISSSAITKKLQEIKGKLKVDEELFKKQIQYNWFFD